MSDSNFYARYSNTFYDTLADKMKKQKFLIENILNKGYNKEEFAAFMISQRGISITNFYPITSLY